MKRHIFSDLFCCCVLLFCCGNSAKWKSGPGHEWDIRVESALRRAKARGKHLLVLKTRLDGDISSRRMIDSVFDNRAVKRYTRDHFEMVCLDFPHNNRMPFRQAQYNRNMASRLGMPDTVPSMVIVNGNGVVIARRNGFIPATACLDFFKEIVGQKKFQGFLNSNQQSHDSLPSKMWTPYMHTHWAQKERKKILILVSGSDRGQECFQLQHNVISSEKFYHFVKKHFSSSINSRAQISYMTYYDFPAKRTVSTDDLKKRAEHLKQMGISTYLPTLAVFDPEKKQIIAQHSGYFSINQCLKFLKDALAGKAPRKIQRPQRETAPQRKMNFNASIPPFYRNKLQQTQIICKGWGHQGINFTKLSGRTEKDGYIYLEFYYALPGIKAQIFVTGDNVCFSSPSPYFHTRGKFRCFLRSNTPTVCRKLRIHLRFEGNTERFLFEELPCHFIWQ